MLEKRFSDGLTVLANYTFSKSLDNATWNKNVPSIAKAQLWCSTVHFHDSLMLDRGPSDFDFRHNFVVSYVWQPAVPKGANPWMRHLLGDWGIGGIGSAQSGVPVTILAGLDRSQTGLVLITPR